MGYYVQGPAFGKGTFMVANYGAEKVSKPVSFESIPAGKGLVVLIDNGFFEAAAFAFDFTEFREFTRADDYRPKTYYLMDLAKAKEASGYTK